MAASGASRGSSCSSNGLPSARRPLMVMRPPPCRKKAVEARPAKRSGMCAGARAEASPEMRRPVTSGVPISRPTAWSASSRRPPGSTKLLVPPPKAARRLRNPSFTAVSIVDSYAHAGTKVFDYKLDNLRLAFGDPRIWNQGIPKHVSLAC